MFFVASESDLTSKICLIQLFFVNWPINQGKKMGPQGVDYHDEFYQLEI